MTRQAKRRGTPATVAEAKVFMTGRSQAVRLPKGYRVSGDSVYVKRLGNGILLMPKTGDRWQDCSRRSINFRGTSHFLPTRVSKSALASMIFSIRTRTNRPLPPPPRYDGLGDFSVARARQLLKPRMALPHLRLV
jgi:virulence-associated protein VagC